jgi:hypothetical protein
MNLNEKFELVLAKTGDTIVGVVGGAIVAVVSTIEALFSTVGDLLGVINDNLGRIKNLFDGKSK